MKPGTLFVFFLLFLANSCRNHEAAGEKKIFRYNEAANITSLDPAFARDQAIIWATNQLFNGLVQLDEGLNIKPCIAYRWDISDNGLQYTFHLRKDVTFHDCPAFKDAVGRPVIAQDFIFSFNRLLDPKNGSPGAWIFNYVKNRSGRFDFFAPDDSTLIIGLSQPFPPFLGLLSMQYCSVVPHEALAYFGPEFRRNPIGTGPFKFKMWKEGVKLVLVKNPRYFEFEKETRLPYLDAVSVIFQPDKQSAFLEFIKGNLDFMSGIDPSYKDELLDGQGRLRPKYGVKIELISQPYLNTEYLGILVDPANGSVKNTPFLNKKLRQALNYAFDRHKMIRYLRNNVGTPGIYGITPKGLPSFDSTLHGYDYNPVKSGKLLAEAGYNEGKNLPALILTSTSDYLDICKYIQHQVSELGIELKIEVSPPAAVKEMKAQAKLHFFRASWIADYPDAENYLSLFYSKNFCPKGPNYTHFNNPEYDRLYEQSMSTINDSMRYLLYRKMEKIMMEESPVIILYYDQVLRFVQKNITGIGINPMNLLVLKRVKKL